MRQIDPGRRPGLPDHAADADHPDLSPRLSPTAGSTTDRQRRVGALGDERRHRSALAGARTITATSSQGLALMAEVVYIAASMRAPIVMAVGNRALSGPINIHCDHSDSMLVRDSGVLQLFAENAQEAYDLMVIAPRVAEHPDVSLPVLVCQDGFTITHARGAGRAARRRRGARLRRRLPARDRAARCRARRRPKGRLRCPTTTTNCGGANRGTRAAPRVLADVAGEFERLTGRAYRRTRRLPARRRRSRDRRAGIVRRHDQGRRRRAARRG